MRSRLSCSIRGKADPTGGRTTDWWLKVSNTGVCPLYVVRLSTPIRNGALVRNVIRAGESYEMPAVLPRSVTAGMKGSAEELAAWEDGIVVFSWHTPFGFRHHMKMRIRDIEREEGRPIPDPDGKAGYPG